MAWPAVDLPSEQQALPSWPSKSPSASASQVTASCVVMHTLALLKDEALYLQVPVGLLGDGLERCVIVVETKRIIALSDFLNSL